MDDATNAQTVDFLLLPKDATGRAAPIPIWTTEPDANHLAWNWEYPNGTIVGEVIFIVDGQSLLPTEVRMRKRYASGWATNAFRPFPEAASLSSAIRAKRPNFASNPALAAVVAQLDGGGALTPTRLAVDGPFQGLFDQSGALDVLPDFGDPALVRELLTTTPFASAYGSTWRAAGGLTAFAASTASDLSIVPKNAAHGLLEVNEASCTRCHKNGGEPLEKYYFPLSLYGEIWGKDGIFTFHPFDESFYGQLDLDQGGGPVDNRHMNPALQQMGFIEVFDAARHTGPFYDRR
jgi:hypothetical protein